jgi:hypothetical protein
MKSFIDLLREDNKIVIFLGAGASVSAGFPTDSELRNKVKDLMANENILPLFEDAGFSKENCSDFRTKLVRGGFPTIDDLINAHPQYAHLGKMAILMSLLRYEESSNKDDMLFEDNHWYMPFFRTIKKANLLNKISNITFVTLNYDRSLQFFIHDFNKHNDHSIQPHIINLHGRLPSLPSEGGMYDVKYGHYDFSGKSFYNHANSIKSLNDVKSESPSYSEAREEILSANYLFIMGFGFHETILEKLKLDSLIHKHLKVYALCYGIESTTVAKYENFAFLKKELTCCDLVTNLNIPLKKLLWREDRNTKLQRQTALRAKRASYQPFDLNQNFSFDL